MHFLRKLSVSLAHPLKNMNVRRISQQATNTNHKAKGEYKYE